MHHLHTAIYHATYPKSWIVMNTIFFTCLIVLFFPAIQHTDSNCRLPIWKKKIYISIFCRSDQRCQLTDQPGSQGNQATELQ